MSYAKLVGYLKAISLLTPNTKQFSEGDISKNLNGNKRNHYNAVNCHLEQAIEGDGYMTYRIVLVYVSRLDDTLETNRLQIQSMAIQSLHNILLTLEQEMDVEISNITYRTFSQRFADECAGAYCYVDVSESIDSCFEEYGKIMYEIDNDDNG